MTNPFLESPSYLRKEWKLLRSQLNINLNDAQQLEKVVNWWSKCPVVNQWLDYDHETTWPDPWELITTKNLDFSAISLGMEYTLLLAIDERWTNDRVHVALATDRERTMQHLVVLVDDKWILNARYNQILELSADFTFHCHYKYQGKKHQQF